MNLSLGIVGLPNVGKSTLFNALTKQSVPAENYPFCTIDPNTGIVPVADKRVDQISAISKPEKIIPAVVEFVDIAGLVKGAASGAGLGNKFLSHIKEVSAIVQVVRAFNNSNITHVENSVDPRRDIELIQTELALKDIDTVTTRVTSIRSRARFDKLLLAELEHLELLQKHLEGGKLAFDFEKPKDDEVINARKSLFLLSDKPVIYLVNSEDPKSADLIKDIVGNKTVIVMDVKTESELAALNDEDRAIFMKEFGLEETGLDRLTNAAYDTLGLMSFFTEGPEEVRAWTILKGSKAPEAGAAIHTDFQKKFIACDVCYYQDFLDAGSWNKAKELGKVGLEGKEYVVRDGDIMIFRHG
ncbi:MAG: redox-regulated ATPase YchF [Candidatus Dojkabacteria bacterium]